MVVQQWERILWIYAYAIYIQEPNSLSVMNVTTWALHCIVLCQSFPLFNKYWRTQIPFYFSRVCFFFWTLVINFAIFPHILQLFQWDFWTLAKQKGTQKVLCRFFSWKLICLREAKEVHFIWNNCFQMRSRKHAPLSLDGKESTSVFYTCEWNLVTYVSFF